MKRWGVVLILVLAFFGLADSAYLAQSAANGMPLLCNIEGFSDCNTVASSPYSRIFGIPLAEFGVLFYSILFVLAALELALFTEPLRRTIQIVAVVGVLASTYFIFLQKFVINAYCIYCAISAAITLLIFIIASFLEPLWKPGGGGPVSPPKLPLRLTIPPRT